MIGFIAGFAIGGVFGIVIMCLVGMSHEEDKKQWKGVDNDG